MIILDLYYDNDNIQWRPIYWKNGEKTKYSISNIGLVRNDVKNKLLKPYYHKGYAKIQLLHNKKSKEFFIHRLVATAFIPNPDNKPQVNHINGDKSCNYDFNLEWVTGVENMQHAYKTGLNKYHQHNVITSIDKVEKICQLLEQNELNLSQIGIKVGVSRQAVGRILQKKTYRKISSKYNIDNYTIKTNFASYGDDNNKTKYSDADITKVCELIDSGYKLTEIPKITGIPYQTVRNVYYGTCRLPISSKYNFLKNR